MASLIRSETIYDENGNNIRHREVYDFTGEISMNIEQKYDENGNLIERYSTMRMEILHLNL